MAYLIKPVADRKPAEPALIDEFGETNWSDFNMRVNRLIHQLRAVGMRAGDVFSVLSGNRREYYEAFAAASHGGWLLVPINFHLVAEEVAYIVSNSESKVLFADNRFADLAEASVAHSDAGPLAARIMIGGSSPSFAEYEEFIGSAVTTEPEDQSMGGPMFYTSGTTGKPKGVKNSLSQVGAPVETMAMVGSGLSGLLSLPSDGTTLLVGPVYHSAQWAFSFLPLLTGCSVVMRNKFDAAETLDLIDEYGVTNTHLVPTQFVRMLRLDDQVRESFSGESLQIVWHGAAPCPPDIKRQMIQWWGSKISEYYGSTEGSIVTTVDSADWLSKPGTVGKPTAIMEVLVIKDDGSAAAPLEAGQIYVKSLMGSDFTYHNDSEKTEQAHREPGVFTFGDMGYLDADGYLFMSDRKIDMIISGGVNIYPAEIESVLLNHPAVLDAAVFGIPNEEFGEEVKAAIELAEGFDSDEQSLEQIISYCREHLAGYKIPRSVDIETTLPRNPTGKLLKRLLREPYWKDQDRSQ